MATHTLANIRHDLVAAQSAVTNLLCKVQSVPTAPSWRFPEKTAVSVVLEDLLGDVPQASDETEGEARLFLMELLVDRILLLLQLSLLLGISASSTPLTLSSTLRKFWKNVVNQSNSIKAQDHQVTTLQCQVNSMERNIARLQEECKLYKSILHTDKNIPKSSSRSEGIACQSVAIGQHISQKNGLGTPESCPATPGVDLKRDMSIQTLETALGTCVHCTAYQKALLSIDKDLYQLCSSTHWQTHSSATSEEVVGRFETKKVLKSIKDKIKSMEESLAQAQQKNASLQEKLQAQDTALSEAVSSSSELSKMISTKESALSETQEQFKAAITKTEDKYKIEFERMSEVLKREESEMRLLKGEVDSARRLQSELQAKYATKEREKKVLEQELIESRDLEAQLRDAFSGVQQQLSALKEEELNTIKQLEEQSIQLNKSEVHNLSLEKRCKYLQTKQAKLLLSMDELEQKCGQLQEEVNDAVLATESMQTSLKEAEVRCEQLQSRLDDQEVKLAATQSEHSRLLSYSSSLEDKLNSSEAELKKEKERCQLLVEYPMMAPGTSFSSHVASLSIKDSQQLVKANTVRILSLEEQNSELRKQSVRMILSKKESEKQTTLISDPLRLWQDTDHQIKMGLSEKEIGIQKDQSSSAKSGSLLTNTLQPTRPASTGMKPLRGKLGFLLTALNDASQTNIAPVPPPPSPSNIQTSQSSSHPSQDGYNNITASMCPRCDKVFCSQEELLIHELHCTTH